MTAACEKTVLGFWFSLKNMIFAAQKKRIISSLKIYLIRHFIQIRPLTRIFT
jgi:hypothetical protein